MSDSISRRGFLNRSIVTASAAGVAASTRLAQSAQPADPPPQVPASVRNAMPLAKLGKASISRLMLGGNLVSGYMHSRDLHYVDDLFRAYVTEAKMMETFALAEAYGINTVFETGAKWVEMYNRRHNGRMQFIPHIKIEREQTEQQLKDHIKQQVDTGAAALYVWGVAGDQFISAGLVDRVGRAVELAKLHGLPVGVGGHSLLVPMACEKHGVPCDFYVKTLHHDNYPSATPKELRKEFIWITGGKGWYDNMWCINPEETVDFMRSVEKPWIAFKILAAGAIRPLDAFNYAFKNGADIVAVGMFDFQIKENVGLAIRNVREHQQRLRPWRA